MFFYFLDFSELEEINLCLLYPFSRSSHVVLSIVKLMSRIVAPSDLDVDEAEDEKEKSEVIAALHDHTYGITSDPLSLFACVFSGLVSSSTFLKKPVIYRC